MRVYSPIKLSYAPGYESIDFKDALKATVGDLGLEDSKIGFDSLHIQSSFYEELKEIFKEATLVDISNILHETLSVKTPEEVELIKKAAELADIGVEAALNSLEAGKRECEVAAAAVYAMRMQGCDQLFESVISGYRTMFGGSRASQKIIEEGDVVTIDLGPFYRGYNADICRTAVIGGPNRDQKKKFEVVLEAEDMAIEAMKPGVKACEVDKVARDLIDEAGYVGGLLHHTGHPIGAAWYTGWGPMLTSECDMFLKENMTFAVEPAICLHKQKLRISNEDDVLITSRGAEKITKFKSILF